MDSEQALAKTMLARVGSQQEALQKLQKVVAWMSVNKGREDVATIQARMCLANAHLLNGNIDEAVPALRLLLSILNRTRGESDYLTFELTVLLVQALGSEKRTVAEARTIITELRPRIARVLGPHHRLTKITEEWNAYWR